VAERVEVTFTSGEARCAAWLYRPSGEGDADGDDAAGAVPIVVMGHGLGAVREMRLDAYAERFVAAGLAVLVFDYRHFGDSEGEPRGLLDIKLQLADWSAAIAFARTIEGVDPERVALWGSSFGGGHVIEAAARDPRVAAVVSQCPFTDGLASMNTAPLRTRVKLTARALRDLLAKLLGRPPVRVALAGPPGSTALMSAPDADDGYTRLGGAHGPEGTVAARIGIHLAFYRPGRAAARVHCPMLICVCEHDTLAPASAARRAGARAPHADVYNYPIRHFDIYFDEAFEHAVADQVEFLRGNLLGNGGERA